MLTELFTPLLALIGLELVPFLLLFIIMLLLFKGD